MTHESDHNKSNFIGAFEILEAIGEGGMGTAWKGRHVATGEPVAVKTIREQQTPQKRGLVLREARALAQLDHPGVIQILDFGQVREAGRAFPKGTLYLVMEYADGGPLQPASIRRWSDIKDLLLQLLDALAHAHSRHRIHLDLKPENILRTSDEKPWKYQLADFGVARITTEFEEPHPSSGTPLYMAPEQARGYWRSLGPWSDLYAVGCIAWQIVTGAPPFQGSSPTAILMGHLSRELPDFAPRISLPCEFEAWLRLLLAKNPGERYRNCADAAFVLARLDLDWNAEQGDDEVSSSLEPPSPQMAETFEHLSTFCIHGFMKSESQQFSMAETLAAQSQETVQLSERQLQKAVSGDKKAEPLVVGRPAFPSVWQWPSQHSCRHLNDVGLGLFDLRPTPFVGRQKVLNQMWNVAGHMIEGPSLERLTIEGASGVGKSRLVDAFGTRLIELGQAQVLRLDFEERYWLDAVVTGLTRFLNAVNAESFILEELARLRIPKISSSEVDFLLHLLGDKDFDSDEEEVDLFEKISRVLEKIAAHRPLLVIADGVALDPLPLELHEYFHDTRPQVPILFVIVVPTDRCSPVVQARLDDISAHRRLFIEPLQPAQVRQSLERIFPLEPSQLQRLVESVDYDLSFGRQVLAHWIDGGYIEAGANGGRGPDEIASSLNQLWMQRLRGLFGASQFEASRQTLAAAAVLGKRVDKKRWIQVCSKLAVNPDVEVIELASRKGFLRDEGERIFFSEASFRQALLQDLKEDGEKLEYIQAAAQILKAQKDRTSLTRAALCLEDVGEFSSALDALNSAGFLFSLRDVITHQSWTNSILERADDVSLHTRIRTAVNKSIDHIQNCEFETADRYLQKAWHLLQNEESSNYSRHFYEYGMAVRALFTNDAASGLEIAEPMIEEILNDESLEVVAADYFMLADLYLFNCQARRALDCFDKALLLIDKDDEFGFADYLYRRAAAELATGDLEKAREGLLKAVPIFLRFDDPMTGILSRELLGRLATYEGEFSKAEKYFKRAITEGGRHHYYGVIGFREWLGRIYARTGRPKEALEQLSMVRQYSETDGFNVMVWYFFDAEAEAYCQSQDWVSVRRVFHEACRTAARPGLYADTIAATWRRVAAAITVDRPQLRSALATPIEEEAQVILDKPLIPPSER